MSMDESVQKFLLSIIYYFLMVDGSGSLLKYKASHYIVPPLVFILPMQYVYVNIKIKDFFLNLVMLNGQA